MAGRILHNVEAYRGKTRRDVIRTCDEYAVDVLGNQRFAPWLYVYSAISGKFKEGWIPDNYYGTTVVPVLKGSYGNVSSLNCLSSAIFRSALFPDLISYANGIFFDTTYRFVPPEAVKDVVFEHHDRVVYKLDNTLRGRGVHILDRDAFSEQKIRELGNGTFQGFNRQHALFDEFQKSAVVTIRMTTVYEDKGSVSLRACYLPLGWR